MRCCFSFSPRALFPALVAAIGLGGHVGQSRAELPPLIPREVLFGNPERVSPKLSPDGKRLAWIAPDSKNVLQVWVKTVGKDDDKVVTADKKRGIRQYEWAENSKTLVYLQDTDGDENWHIYGVDLNPDRIRDFTPQKGVQARITATNPNFPDEILVSLNQRDPHLHDVYRLNVTTGELTLDTKNPGDVAGFMPDPKFQIRAAQVVTPDGGTEIRTRDDAKSDWRTWLKVGPEEILNFVDFTPDGKSVTLISSLGSDTARVVERNIANGEERVIAASTEVDAGSVVVHPTRHVVQAVGFAPGRVRWEVIDPTVKDDFAAIGKLNDGDFQVVNRNTADTTWLVGFTSDRGPIRYYTWDRSSHKGMFLFSHQPKLEGLALAEMKPVVITSRDGLKLNAYLTLPVGEPAKGLPMVLFVHGGPWGRDMWGFNPMAQWFANRGYACLMVNFRASTGYGKAFLNAGNKQWGLKMHDDLIDAVNWAVRQGYADPQKVAIFGGSYGGYAALAGVTFTPDVFACAVDIVGPSNLKTLISSIPPYWKPMRAHFDVRMGNVDDPKDAELIKNASPLFKADQIKRPLLIGQGANDPRVNQAESEQIVSAIAKNGGSVTYVLYTDEGHGFRRPENSIDFNARAEAFLAANLGGRCEPMSGDKYPGSTAVVKVVGK
ncbi:MAG TPA: S9 family peptidase [Isosphaeraceae bacterium]|jgi:dipeptidyl aminopeptidase/acylaminoacyl peptidase|nr:S9 family peptidase [Isosphaeraceae bacterium]